MDSGALELVLEALWVELGSWEEDACWEDSGAFELLVTVEWAAEVVATAVLAELETEATVLVAMSEMAEAEECGLHDLLL